MIQDALNYIKDLFIGLFKGFITLFTDIFIFIFDVLMTAIMLLLEGLTSLMDFMDFSQYYDNLPPEFVQAASAIGLGQVFGIVLAAHGIKLLVQLIPFVRLGAK